MTNETKIDGMELVYKRPGTMTDTYLHYCPGCSHGVVHKVLMEVIEEMGIQEETVGVIPVGCAVFAYNYMDIDVQEASHGRATAVATGVKRSLPDKYVFSYQGDGDLAAIGTGETIHTVNRGENIVIIFINNATYGMTGGQMAPTTLKGQVTTTTPFGRDIKQMGDSFDITSLVARLPGAYYVTRQSVHTPNAVRKLKKAIKFSFEAQNIDQGTCFIEVVSNCPSGWRMTPLESIKYLEDVMFPAYPLGDIKVPREHKSNL
jgi:2-oxoglutarate ferredoxin oxidoreductase subunit beta